MRKTKSERREYERGRRLRNDRRAYMRKWYLRQTVTKTQRLRYKVLNHYGHRCQCCGETLAEFLALDHVYGGGNKERRETGTRGIGMYRKAIQEGYPDRFRLLCHNCNHALGSYGKCPHGMFATQSGPTLFTATTPDVASLFPEQEAAIDASRIGPAVKRETKRTTRANVTELKRIGGVQ